MNRKAKRNRLLTMIFGAAAIFFTGYPHVWSLYSPFVMAQTGWSASQSSMCFYLALFSFVFGNIIGGRIQDKSNPIKVLSIGGIIQAAGILLSSFLLISNPLPMYLTYGGLHGFGQGMVYTVILSTAQKWFPQRKGFASGIIVTANGLCGFFLAPFSKWMIASGGPRLALLVVGILMAFAWIFSVIFVKIPTESEYLMEKSPVKEKNMVHEYTAREMVGTKKFYFLAATMMFGLISYFLISPISQTLQIERGLSETLAVSSVMLGSIMNAGARLILPALADKVGRIPCVKGILLVAAGAMGLLAVSQSFGTTIGIVIMYGCYGGIMGSFPALSSSIFGLLHSGENYGYVMSGVVAATISAPLITNVVMNGNNQNRIFWVGIGCAITGFLLITLLNRELTVEKHDKKEVKECL